MSYTAAVANKMRAAWFGSETGAVAAAAFNISKRTLQRFWRCEQSGGRLPAGERPQFLVPAKHLLVPVLPETPAAAEGDDDLDDVEGDIDNACLRVGSDMLLALLRKHHGTDRFRGVNDEMPLIITETERFDRAGIYTPSRSRVRDFQRGRDAYVGARIRVKGK
jgi:hypothetical protein